MTGALCFKTNTDKKKRQTEQKMMHWETNSFSETYFIQFYNGLTKVSSNSFLNGIPSRTNAIHKFHKNSNYEIFTLCTSPQSCFGESFIGVL